MREMRLAAALVVYFGLAGGPSEGQTVFERGRVDEATAVRAADHLYGVLWDAILSAGGRPADQAVHLVIGFSTGHFADDPLQAEATRLTARHLADRLLVPGDTVSVFAWELGIWDHSIESTWGIRVRDSSVSVTNIVTDMMPLGPAKGSEGGHDTELAIVEAFARLGQEANAVVVLLTNSAASVRGRPYQSLIGPNDPRYLRSIARAYRAPSVNRAGASAVLDFQVELPDGRRINRTAEAIVVVSKPFSGPSLSTPRPDRVSRAPEQSAGGAQNEAAAREDGTGRTTGSGSGWWGLIVLVTIVLVTIVVYLLWSHLKGGQLALRVNGEYVETQGTEPGQALRRFVGEGFGTTDGRTIILRSMPGEEVLKLVYLGRGKGFRLEKSPQVTQWSVNGVPVNGDRYVLGSPNKYEVEVRTRVNTNGVPEDRTCKVTLELAKKE